jgi:hypothetical protein
MFQFVMLERGRHSPIETLRPGEIRAVRIPSQQRSLELSTVGLSIPRSIPLCSQAIAFIEIAGLLRSWDLGILPATSAVCAFLQNCGWLILL